MKILRKNGWFFITGLMGLMGLMGLGLLAACSAPQEKMQVTEGTVVFTKPPQTPVGPSDLTEPALPSPVGEVEMPPAAHPPTLPQTALEAKIQNNRTETTPGHYTFIPIIQGGQAPYQVHWGCTSATHRCPVLSTTAQAGALPQAEADFSAGQYQIDLSIRDAAGNRASETLPLTVASAGSGLVQNPALRDLDARIDVDENLGAQFNDASGGRLSGNNAQTFDLSDVYSADPLRGLADIQGVLTSSHFTRYQSWFSSIPEANRIEGKIRMRFPRHSIRTYPEGQGVFQNPVLDEYFPTQWISLSLKGCTEAGSCQTLVEEIPFAEDPTLGCNAQTNSGSHCEGEFEFRVLSDEVSEGNFRDLDYFKIEVQETQAAYLEVQDNQYQLCESDGNCPRTHPNCVAGLCSAIRPGTLFEAHLP